MKYGVYFTYWVNDYIEDFRPMLPRAKKCGLDILEVGAFNFCRQDDSYFRDLRAMMSSRGSRSSHLPITSFCWLPPDRFAAVCMVFLLKIRFISTHNVSKNTAIRR